MDYNKRRWLDRQRQKHQEEEPRKEYEAVRHTYFSKQENYYYVAEVKVFERYSTIDLSIERYEQEIQAPFWAKFILRLLEEDKLEQSGIIVPTRVISNNEIVKRVIKRMITDYEIALYQEYMVMEEDETLAIEYDKELIARLQRRPKIIDDQETQQQTFQQDYEVTDYLSGGEEVEADPVEELSKKTGRDPNSLKNLVQFRDKKSS